MTILLIVFMSAAGFTGWYYWWTTHAVFEFRVHPIVVLEGQSVNPGDFIYPGEGMERVSAVFRNPRFRPEAGRQSVPLTLARGWRTVDTTATLYVLTPVEQIQNEFTAEGPELKAIDFISNAAVATSVRFDVRFTEEPLPLEEYPVGVHTLHLAMNDTAFEVTLNVVDTTPPTATAVNKTIWIGEEVTPEDFVTDEFDASGIESILFVEEPDIFARTDQIVEIEITDIYGNSAYFRGALNVLLNREYPTIEGADTIVSQPDIPIDFHRGGEVKAYDSFGRELEIKVNLGNLDQDTVGEYTVTYWVVDFTGQRTEVDVDVHIVDIDIEYVQQRVDETLAEILNDGMTQLEKVRAIHAWVRNNVSYSTVRGGPATSYEGAYIALMQRRGNCYIFYSISEVMLTRAGIPNMRIERIPGTPTRHLWNLVNPDGLGWHHYDSFFTRLGLGTQQMSYFTSTQAASISRQIQEINNMRDYYTYDPDLYPEIAR